MNVLQLPEYHFNANDKPEFNLNELEDMKTDFKIDIRIDNVLASSGDYYSVSNFNLNNNESSYRFAKNIDLFRKYAQQIFDQSLIFYNVTDIDTSIFLMDRLLKEIKDINIKDFTKICSLLDDFKYYIDEILNDSKDKKYI